MLTICLYEDIDKEDVIHLVLHCQNDGSRPVVGVEEQPDLLDTPKNTERAHEFYNRAGWRKVLQEDLPLQFDHPYQDSDFFLLNI